MSSYNATYVVKCREIEIHRPYTYTMKICIAGFKSYTIYNIRIHLLVSSEMNCTFNIFSKQLTAYNTVVMISDYYRVEFQISYTYFS